MRGRQISFAKREVLSGYLARPLFSANAINLLVPSARGKQLAEILLAHIGPMIGPADLPISVPLQKRCCHRRENCETREIADSYTSVHIICPKNDVYLDEPSSQSARVF
jgi:hypothetical protein